MSFNLDTLALSPTATLHLQHPVTQEYLYADEKQTKPVSVELYGTSSKEYRQAILALQNRALAREKTKKKATAEQMKEEGVGLLVACSEKINNLTYLGKPVDNAEAFRALYSDPKFSWLREQCDAFLGDVAGFLEK